MKLRYCCKWPNQWLFIDTIADKKTAVVHCSACQNITGEIWIETGKDVRGEEE